jgi:hypothetical protein
VTDCPGCGGPVDRHFRFCPWCAVPQRRKLTDFFLGHGNRALRVSRYLVPGERQVRVSVWSDDGVAEAAVSLEDAEAERLARFLCDTAREPSEETLAGSQ